MRDQDDEQFCGLMAMLSEVFDDGKELSAAKISVYFEALKPYNIDKVNAAVIQIIRGRVYSSFPKPGEIIREIDGDAETRAMESWTELVDARRRVGPYRSIKFTDEVIHAIVDFWGGWPAVNAFTDRDMDFKQKEFLRLYAAMEGRHKVIAYLSGETELTNGEAFREYTDPPAVFGRPRCDVKQITSQEV